MKTLFLFTSITGISGMLMAQNPSEQVQRMNTIKFEISQALYPHSFILSYERVTKPNQSFCISGGYEEFPDLVNISSTTRVKQDLNKSGFKVGADYRFYLKKENKYLAPHGVYLGPYFSYHNFYNKREIEVNVDGALETAEVKSDFRVANIGFQLGYQFVLGSHWTFDIVAIGPSVSNYHANLKTNGEFTFDKDEIQNEVILKLLDKFPMLEDLLTNTEVSASGKFDSWAIGWRYQFLVGYHFGKKKKK